jgi:mRNA interferase RelE/StbE
LAWTVEWDERAIRELKKLDRHLQRTIVRYMRQRIMTDEDPRRFGKALQHELVGLWRYRVGDIRLVCHIRDRKITVRVLPLSPRRKVYR